MRITRPAGGIYKSRRLMDRLCDPKVSRSGGFHGVCTRGRRERGWRKEKTERKMRNGEGEKREQVRTEKGGNSMQ